MNNLFAIIINSAFENIELLNNEIYFKAKRDGYHHLTTITNEGIQQSIFIFNNLQNREFIETLINGYEWINDADIIFDTIKDIQEYKADEFAGSPTRVRITLNNGKMCNVPYRAINDLNYSKI